MRNKFEKDTHRQLKRLKSKFSYESERIPYVIERNYIPDFIVETPNGKIYIECKGYLRPEDREKLSAVRRCNPGIDLRILFYSSQRKQIRWAEKHKIPYAVGTIPKDWIAG